MSEAEKMTDRSFDKELDCSGQLCPMPVYVASKAMSKLEKGQILKVICTDPGAKRDFPAFAKQGGHLLLDSEEEGKSLSFWLQKGGAQ